MNYLLQPAKGVSYAEKTALRYLYDLSLMIYCFTRLMVFSYVSANIAFFVYFLNSLTLGLVYTLHGYKQNTTKSG